MQPSVDIGCRKERSVIVYEYWPETT